MSDLPNLAKLRDDHLRLMGIARRLGALIERDQAPPHLHLFALRHELSATLIGHLKTEDWLLYPELLGSPDPHIAATARTFADEMGGLGTAYEAHCNAWGAGAISANWIGYCTACREILDALTIRITRENRELFPLLETLARAA